jgi:hypothetical protein
MKSYRALFIATAFIIGSGFAAQAAHKDVKHCAADYKK